MLRMILPQSATRRRAVRTTTMQACGLYPAVGAPSLDPRGVIIGREIYSGRAWIYDPFVLYDPTARERLASGHVLVLGKSGHGKSALEKTYVLRQLRFRNRSFCVLDAQGEDGRGEWDQIARSLGITPIRLVYGGSKQGVRFNPLDSRIPARHQFRVLSSMVEILAGALSSEADFALSQAHSVAAGLGVGEPRTGPVRRAQRADAPRRGHARSARDRCGGPGGVGPARLTRPGQAVRPESGAGRSLQRPYFRGHRPRRTADRL